VVDPSVVIAFNEIGLEISPFASLSSDDLSISQFIRQGDDGAWFLDYLRPKLLRKEDLPSSFDSRMIWRHKKAVIGLADSWKGGHEPKTDPSLNAKVSWLTKYHNSVVDHLTKSELKSMGTTCELMRIDTQCISPMWTF
jgi:hypothetical protein